MGMGMVPCKLPLPLTFRLSWDESNMEKKRGSLLQWPTPSWACFIPIHSLSSRNSPLSTSGLPSPGCAAWCFTYLCHWLGVGIQHWWDGSSLPTGAAYKWVVDCYCSLKLTALCSFMIASPSLADDALQLAVNILIVMLVIIYFLCKLLCELSCGKAVLKIFLRIVITFWSDDRPDQYSTELLPGSKEQ